MTKSMYKQTRWRLDDLYPGPDSPELQRAFEQVEEETQAFEALRHRLKHVLSTAEFNDILREYENLIRFLSRVLHYGFLLFSEDMKSYQAQTCWERAQQISAQAESRTLFFNLWWNTLDQETNENLVEAAADYRHWLETLRLQEPFTLSEIEEKIVNLKDATGLKALIKLYETITSRYVYKLEINGEVNKFTRHELKEYVRYPEPDVREAAYMEYLRAFEQDAPILGQIYQNRVRDWRGENVVLRGYASPIAVRNLANDLPDNVVEVLLEVCRNNVSLFHKYFQLKARTLGVERLRRYDIYAPVTRSEKTYEFKDAANLVLDSFRRFEPQFADLADKVFKEHHLDSEVREGKRPGAFCAVVEPGLTPWISLTFEGWVEDVAGLARELGRAIHYMMAAHHTTFTQKASRMLSEVASTFCEMLAVDHLLATDCDPETQWELLFRRMDNAYATIMRQAYFVMFERTAHDCIHAGATVNELCEIYFENLTDQFSGSIDLSGDFRYEWLGISTFYHLPFYAYAYTFGRLLVLSLYRQHQMEGDTFKSRYLPILAAGGSDSPARILKEAGIDITSASIWQSGFDVLAKALKELEAIESMRRQD